MDGLKLSSLAQPLANLSQSRVDSSPLPVGALAPSDEADRAQPIARVDRAERSAALEERLAALRAQLASLPPAPRVELDRLRGELDRAGGPPRDMLLRAATALLRGAPAPLAD